MPNTVTNTAAALPPTGHLAIRINIREEIGFHKSVMRLLGNPIHLNFWWSEQEHMLLVSAAENPTDKSVTMPVCFYTRKHSPRFRNRGLQMAIQALTGSGDDVTLKWHGEYIPELKMVAFRADCTEGADCHG